MRKNILFSTTRQWNPGDEFILLGIINIFKDMHLEFNPIIYNRNPEIRQKLTYLNPFRSNGLHFKKSYFSLIISSFFRYGFLDNSFKNDTSGKDIDLVVLAGSPEWISYSSINLFNTIDKYNIPLIGLGLGTKVVIDVDKKNPIFKKVFNKNLKLVTTRDKKTKEILSAYKSIMLPCPALFSATKIKQVFKVKKIAIAYGVSQSVEEQKVSISSENTMNTIIEYLNKDFEVNIVCHYIDEIEIAKRRFPNNNILYSYDSKDYENIYYPHDLVIGTRVHGIGICASMCIPGICISHDNRAETVKGFLAEIISDKIDIDGFKIVFDRFINKVDTYSIQLKEHKINTLTNYKEQLVGVI